MIMEDSFIPLNKIPKFRLIGSKHSVLGNLSDVIIKEEISGQSFFDVFSGNLLPEAQVDGTHLS